MPRLLGSHVVESAYGGSFASHSVVLGQVDRQPQVGQLRCSVTGNQDVVGVDIAMDQPFAMCMFKPQGNLPHKLDGSWWRKIALRSEIMVPMVLPSMYSMTR